MRKVQVMILVMVLTVAVSINAQTKLASVFGDHMVLQRNTTVKIWGTDKPNKKIQIVSGWGTEASVKSDADGSWSTSLITTDAGGSYSLTITGSSKVELNDILLGEVWLCSGQSNMEMPLKGNPGQPVFGSHKAILNSTNSNIRLFKVDRAKSTEPQSECMGEWTLCNPETASEFSAVAYFYGKLLQEQLNVPIGLINSSWGGTPAQAWTPESIIDKDFEYYSSIKNDTIKYKHKTPSVLFNAMINPLIPYTIKGAIWYQGEGNRFNAKEYETLFPAMIQGWRERFKVGEFPFYFVQIAPFGWAKEDWVQLQQSQLKTMMTLANTGMAVTSDLGNETCIHPPKKQEVGERLAYWAMAKTYGIKGICYSGPVYNSMEIKEGKAYLQFDYAPLGVTDMYLGLKDFEIAGEDKNYVSAQAKISKGQLCVWSDSIQNPVTVRYGWKPYFEASLFNTAGLPASSFCTENLDEILENK